MNGKDEKREKPLKSESAGEPKIPAVTTWTMLISGALFAVLLGIVPAEWWLEENSPIKQATAPLLALVSASMVLATVLLTTNYFDNRHKVWAYLITGLVAWVAVFSTIPESIPTTPDAGSIFALFMLVAMTPLFIAFIGPRMARPPVKGVPLYLLIGGVAMAALSIVLETTRAGLVLALLGITAPESVNALLSVSGIVLALFALLWGIAKSRG